MAGQYIKEVRDKLISSLVVDKNIDEVDRITQLDSYVPITNNIQIHPDDIPNLTNHINNTITDIATDLTMVNKEVKLGALNLKTFLASAKLRLDNSKNILEQIKQRKEDAELISYNYNSSVTVVELTEDMFSGSYLVSGSSFGAQPTSQNKITLTINDIDGNGYEGNKYVVDSDGNEISKTVDTSVRSNIVDSSLSTIYEYSRITISNSEKVKCVDANVDSVEALCYLTFQGSEPFECLKIYSDINFKVNSLYVSSDGTNFSQIDYPFDTTFNNIITFPVTEYVKIGLESIGCTTDTIAFDASLIESESFVDSTVIQVPSKTISYMLLNPTDSINISTLNSESLNKDSINSKNITLTDTTNNKDINIDGMVTLQDNISSVNYISLPDTILINNSSIKITDKNTFPQKFILSDCTVEINKDVSSYKVTVTRQFINITLPFNLTELNNYRLSISNVICTDGTLSQINKDIYIKVLDATYKTVIVKKEVPLMASIKCILDTAINEAYVNSSYIYLIDKDLNIIDSNISLGTDNNTIIVTPKVSLNNDSKYSIILCSDTLDINDNALGSNYCIEVNTKSSDISNLQAVSITDNSIALTLSFPIQDDGSVYLIDNDNNVLSPDITVSGANISLKYSFDSSKTYMLIIDKGAKNLQGVPIGITYYVPIN